MIEKDLDSLNQQVDELNRLIDETTQPEKVDEDLRSKRNIRLGILILKMQDGALPDPYVHRLGKWLAADASAREYYLEFMELCAMLRFHFQPDLVQKSIAAVTGEKAK